MDSIKKVYRELAEIPVLESARIIETDGNQAKIYLRWAEKNFERGETLKTFQEYTVNLADKILKPSSFPIDVSSELLTAHSQDESLKAILKEVKVDGKSKQFIEIWNKRKIIKNYDLAAYDVHGKVYADSFGSFELSPDNSKLMYIAEKKLSKSGPFFKPKQNPDTESGDGTTLQGHEYAYKENWGESCEDKHRSVTIILDLKKDSMEILNIEDSYFPVQTVWAPNSNDIVGVVYKLETRYLGLVFCTNRESYIFQIKNGVFKILSEKNHCSRSPQFSPDGKCVVYITRTITLPHHNSQSFKFINWDTEKHFPDNATDTPYSLAIPSNQFYGLYNLSFPKRCWSHDSKYLFVSTPHVWTERAYFISFEKNQVSGVINADDDSLVVLDVYKDIVVFARSSLTEPSHLVVAKFEKGQIGELICCRQDPIPCLESLRYKLQILEYTHEGKEDESAKETRTYNYIYLGKKKALKKLPVVVILHGGPNTAINNEFNLIYSFFAALGFGVLLINYRGSAGADPKALESLIGNIGTNDYEDCLNALGFALATITELDFCKITLFGGSHGGYLTAHLSARNPRCFKAAVMRNPVIDIAALFTMADAPEWCTAQINHLSERLPEDVKPPFENKINLKRDMLLRSPIIHVDECTVPTMIALGSNDRRCPPSQGKLWYYNLKKRNVDTKLYWYNDNHSLNKFEVAIDFHINAALWLINHTRQEMNVSSSQDVPSPEIMELMKRAEKFTEKIKSK